ncbi:hypothetical protein [Mesorhizobium sp. BR1-1-7]|uniref:hypothetical protein n=1 Tax=Mesorhizobium sp. BR1-1-7 TaxID=2876647 RepID=UPI00296256A8|nr:hypothetical protein [Mesorhizobium sp. BR1-1-7]
MMPATLVIEGHRAMAPMMEALALIVDHCQVTVMMAMGFDDDVGFCRRSDNRHCNENERHGTCQKNRFHKCFSIPDPSGVVSRQLKPHEISI